MSDSPRQGDRRQSGPSRQPGPSRRRPRPSRRGFAWLALTAALAAGVAGAVLPQALLLAGGLALTATAAHLFQPARGRRGRPPPTG
ncbi:hypothetical protein ACF1BN_25890 [Streptomyces sp. NPDC014861]|uniref:hypothetical protein n=1 Tax=Streptomyces sp. NPDC014861 TaxID=3364923 RepID=UPI0036F9765A